MSNDGARDGVLDGGGTGLANLRARSAEAGGTLTVRREDDRFTLVAEFPAPALSAA
ncbi:hypothetical protein AB0J52_15330 [Spirillospora sp. NPDC049652]